MEKTMNKRELFHHCAKIAMTSLCLFGASANPAAADPTGGVVIAGDVNFHTLEGSPVIGVTQNTASAIVEWQSFDLADGESFFFDQPTADAIILNRILGAGSSLIDGALTANGHLVFVNGDGILFGENSVIDVNGLLATTTGITNTDFMSGDFDFALPGANGASVINRGMITAAEAGLIALVAPNVVNEGIIHARLGRVSLGAGERFTLDFFGDGLVAFSPNTDAGMKEGEVAVVGSIIAEGGIIQLSVTDAAAFIETVINVEADLIARSAYQEGGKIILAGTGTTSINVDAKLDVSGADGGEILIAGKEVSVADGAELIADGLQPPDGLLWTFQNSFFGGADGGTPITGTFIYDAATDTYSEISVLTGFGASLPGANYIGPGVAPSAGQIDFLSTAGADITGAYRLYIGFNVPLTDAGGTLMITYGAEQRCVSMYCTFPGFGINARGMIGSTSIVSSTIPFAGMQNGGTINVGSDERTDFAGIASVVPGPAEGVGGEITLSSNGLLVFTGTAELGEAARAGSLTLTGLEMPDDMTEEIKKSVKLSLSEIASTGNASQSQQSGIGGGNVGNSGSSGGKFGGLLTIGDDTEGVGGDSEDKGLLCLHGVSEAACGNAD